MECVPNFSEGRDLQKIDKIVAPFRGKQGVKLLDYSNDEDHNRLVVTVVGEPEPLRDAVLEAIGVAVELIDLNHSLLSFAVALESGHSFVVIREIR